MSVAENLRARRVPEKGSQGRTEGPRGDPTHFPASEGAGSPAGSTLSGGEQQMLAIAAAVMCKPRMLLLDEPSMGLSPLMVSEIGKIVREINDRGTTVLLVEQNSRLALKLATRAYVLETGSIVVEGTGRADAQRARRKAYLGE